MTTQNKMHPEVTVPSARRSATDGPSAIEGGEAGSGLETKLRQLVDDGKGRATQWKGEFLGVIREKPIQSLLVATAVGALIGLLVGRRR